MSADARLEALKAWLAGLYPQCPFHLAPASADASFRRYFRVSGLESGSLIVMDAPPDREDTAPFRDVAQRLARADIRVPAIRAADIDQGFLLLEDLGRETYLEAFSYRDPAPLMEAAVDTLVRMQSGTETEGLPEYDRDLLMRELALFPDWYLARERGIDVPGEERELLESLFRELCDRALAQPRVFVHRDFMPRNLMASHPAPGVIDFQDAVLGPISYDPVCLFMDAFHSFPAATVQAGLSRFHRQALAAGLPVPHSRSDFLDDCRWMAVHRHLKVIGIFARIAHRDGKPHYLSDVPRFFAYLRQAAAAEPALRPLQSLIERWSPGAARGASA
ncbi:aminoglycoside phosphotransferase family protein [Natronospira bacteriovora]|uniref:Phosphotransferase n=1 Tax=Natronospira bacteriovora TaxID=3069753 RepID=A0ABU0W4E0_9GAMM|nr:phosphotransferase [Natronospira sp. AB-CW4]MDQ2068768.1 phosphotransferase [Natronospira sp. AB-CW4]